MVALTILSIAFFGLAGSSSIGLRIVAEGRQREAATEIANGRLEHLRDIPYASLALNTAPTHSSTTTNPDYKVSIDNTQFDPGTGSFEDLDLDTTNGQVPHLESPVAVGPIVYSVYQFVTWVDDPAGGATTHDYKRLTGVAWVNTPGNTGRPPPGAVSGFLPSGKNTNGGAAARAARGNVP